MEHKTYDIDFGGKKLSIEVGKLAKQAHGSCKITYGDSVILVTACRGSEPMEGIDFLPLTVQYQEMTYAAGKIPGGFFKREGRQNEREILCSRLIDRGIRPLFKEGYAYDTQVIATVMSVDEDHPTDVIAAIGASIALGISDLPFEGPISSIRLAQLDGEFIVNPSLTELKESELDLLVTASEDGILMVEGGGDFAQEDTIVEALLKAEELMKPINALQDKIVSEVGKAKIEVTAPVVNEDAVKRVKEVGESKLREALSIKTKMERYAKLAEVKKEIVAELSEEFEDDISQVKTQIGELKYNMMRGDLLKTKTRVDGRGPADVRQIDCEVGVLPRTHGSGLFTRGETQALVIATLGSADEEQRIDAITGWEYKRFMLHYNFPPFCVGESRMLRGPSRREIGHGALAERAMLKVLPKDDNPYTIRIVSEVLESNGSSSMATVCGASMSLMDAGIKIKGHTAGIAMGMIQEGDDYVILSDILGDEDHLGDMDFKVAGTTEGITALQMDIKVKGITAAVLQEAMAQAKVGRLHIIGEMDKAITGSREELSQYAPRIVTIQVKQSKIKDIIGPGGKIIKGIVADTGVKMNVDDDGVVSICSADAEGLAKAVAMVEGIIEEAEIGKIYKGEVKRITDFGAFVGILPGKDGLVHISQIAHERVEKVTDVLKEGQIVEVKCIDIDREGKVRLSMKELIEK